MPLVRQTFVQGLLDIYKYPDSLPDAAEKWATAFDDYASQVIPQSTTASAAKAAFKAMFMTMTGATYQVVFPNCFVVYAAALAPGMMTLQGPTGPVWTPTPPPGAPILAPVFALGLSGASNEDVIQLMTTIVDSWMRTGIAINNYSGVTINWS